jgi:hypothetical protein
VGATRAGDDHVHGDVARAFVQKAATPNRRFEFQKRRQLFIRLHDQTLPVAAMRVSNEDRSSVGIYG